MFWNKDKTEFEIGDCVEVKKGVKFPKLNVDINDWQGRVREIDKKSLEVELDSVTLKSLDEAILNHYFEIEEYPHLITIPKKDVEKCEARDSYDEVEIAQDELISKIDEKDVDEPEYQKLSRKWTRHFIRSEYYSKMDKTVRLDTDSVLEIFTNQMYDYEDKTPKRWNTMSAKEVFLNWAPRKISADRSFYESYVEILLNYFKFLEERKYLKTASSIGKLLLEVKDEIVIRSEDSSNWGMAKSFVMGAKQSNVNLNNQEEVDSFMFQEELKAMEKISKESGAKVIRVPRQRFKNIGRNEKVKVKYENGEIQEVKFKKVERDLLKGSCKLVEE